MPFTASELVECARREVTQRRRVYPRLVENGRMTQEKADRETAMMVAIAELLEQLAGRERLF
jgi:hypothetical protein